MKPLRRQDLRHRITIRRLTQTSNGKGGYTSVWAPSSTVWAEVTGLAGRESVMDQVLQGTAFYRIRVRYGTDIKEADQLRSAGNYFRGRDVNVRSVNDPDGKLQQLVILGDTASTR